MEWFKKFFGKKTEVKQERKVNTGRPVSNRNSSTTSPTTVTDDDLLNPTNLVSPLNPLSPISLWSTNVDDTISQGRATYEDSTSHFKYSSGGDSWSSSNDSTSYDHGSSFDSSSSGSFD